MNHPATFGHYLAMNSRADLEIRIPNLHNSLSPHSHKKKNQNVSARARTVGLKGLKGLARQNPRPRSPHMGSFAKQTLETHHTHRDSGQKQPLRPP
jgi:hypothetical protein